MTADSNTQAPAASVDNSDLIYQLDDTPAFAPAIFAALQQRDTRYASVLGALLELSGEKAKPVTVKPDESLDESWEEPVVFDGCSTKGQSNQNQPQTIHIVRKNAANTAKIGVSV